MTTEKIPATPRVDALMAKWDDDGATRGSAFIELRDLARELERAASQPPAPMCHAPAGATRCVICGSDEPRTGTCGSDDRRALCNLAAPDAAHADDGDVTEAMIQAGIAALTLTAQTAPNAELAVTTLYRAMRAAALAAVAPSDAKDAGAQTAKGDQ